MRKLLVSLFATALVVATDTAAVTSPAPSQAYVSTLRRMTAEEYRSSIADVFGKTIEVRGVFEPTVRMGGLQAASTTVLSVTPAGFESFSKMADSIAAQVTSEAYRPNLPCTPKNPKAADDACAGQILADYGLKLFRRPLSPDGLKRRIALSRELATKSNDFYFGLHHGLASLLQAPDFVFRKEIAVPTADGKGYTLDAYSRATRLSYLLWGTAPDAELLKAAEAGELNTQAGLSKQVDRLMASPRLEMGMRAFFNDMLELDTFDTVTKDALLYPKWGAAIAASAREETLRTAIALTLKQDGDVRDLMTTRKTYIDRRMAAIYGVAFPFTGDWVEHEFPVESGRSGILTHASMLAMFSHPGRTSPTIRGVHLMDILLCAPTPPPPPNVDFTTVNDVTGTKTTRERLQEHATNRVCASCHNHSDPVGLALENFDTIGGYRTHENGKQLDVSASLQGKSFTGAQGAGAFMHDNPKVTQCMARKLYSYGRGLDSGKVKPDAYQEAYKSFESSGFRLRALLKAFATSESFYAAAPPASAPEPARTVAAAPRATTVASNNMSKVAANAASRTAPN